MIRVQREDFDPGAELATLTANNAAVGGAVSFVGLVRDMAAGQPIRDPPVDDAGRPVSDRSRATIASR